MTAVATERYAVRVMVTLAWDSVTIQVDDTTTVAQLKRDALRAALKTTDAAPSCMVKFRGAAVLDDHLEIVRRADVALEIPVRH